jgi:hypothetical protein
MAPKVNTEVMTFQPSLLLCTPPDIMTMKDTRAQSSTMTEKEIRKPVVLHMWQKLCLPAAQSEDFGKE